MNQLTKCPYCQFPVKAGQGHACEECGAVHHEDCWAEGGGCSVTGCPGAGSAPGTGEGSPEVPTRVQATGSTQPSAPPPPVRPPRLAGQVPATPPAPGSSNPSGGEPPAGNGTPSNGWARLIAAGVLGLVLGAGLVVLIGSGGSDGPTEAELTEAQDAVSSAEARVDQISSENQNLKSKNARLQRQKSSLSGQVAGLKMGQANSAAQPAPAPVESSPSTSSSGTWITQVGSFSTRSNAENRVSQLQAQGFPAEVLWSSDYPGLSPGYWVAYAGFFDKRTAEAEAQRAVGLGIPDAFANDTAG